MHHIYTTPAFVIHSTPHGEAGKFLLLFTRDFGMIGATAQGIRLSQSKLRYHVQDYNFSNISIVRGKEIWRLTGAHGIDRGNNSLKNTIVHLKILKFLKRLLHGEEKNDKLFEIIEELYKTEVKENEYELVESLSVLRILNTLGYIRNTDQLNIFLENSLISGGLLENVKKLKTSIINTINISLDESHL